MVKRCARTADESSGTSSVRAAYIHKAEFIDERKLMLQWWVGFLDANREREVSPFDFATLNTG